MCFKVLLFFTFYTATYYSGYNVITLSFTSAILFQLCLTYWQLLLSSIKVITFHFFPADYDKTNRLLDQKIILNVFYIIRKIFTEYIYIDIIKKIALYHVVYKVLFYQRTNSSSLNSSSTVCPCTIYPQTVRP